MFTQKSILRSAILHLIAILFVVFNICDIKINGLAKLVPLFDLAFIFYFAIFRKIFSIWFIFLLGIWNDALNGNFLGVTALIYIVLVQLFSILNQRILSQENFRQIWQQFYIFTACFLVLKWLILSMLNNAFYNITTLVVQFILTISFYVVMHRFFDYLHQKLIEEK